MKLNRWKRATIGFVVGAGYVVILHWLSGCPFERGAMLVLTVGLGTAVGVSAGAFSILYFDEGSPT